MAEQLIERLSKMYERQNTPRLIRKVFNLERARDNEETNNEEAYLTSIRSDYYSHRLHVLEKTLRERAVNINDIDLKTGERYKYQKYHSRNSRKSN